MSNIEQVFLVRDPDGILEDQIVSSKDGLQMALDAGFIDITHDEGAFARAEHRDIMRSNSSYYGY